MGMPINSSTKLDKAMASEVEGLRCRFSVFNMQSMGNVMELLADMLQAVNPEDQIAVKDEVIVDLADWCHANQKKLMQMLTVTVQLLNRDEELLVVGLELHDAMQSVLAKHDAIDSRGSPSKADGKMQTIEPSSATPLERNQVDEEEENDEFAQTAQRRSKPYPNMPMGAGEDIASSSNGSSDSVPSNALVFPDIPAPVKTMKEQDMIGLLSIVLSTSSTSPQEHLR
ncbi:hypothetical protein Ancab_031473 [Ancistrocladus abbreviatus]